MVMDRGTRGGRGGMRDQRFTFLTERMCEHELGGKEGGWRGSTRLSYSMHKETTTLAAGINHRYEFCTNVSTHLGRAIPG
jgi:hypothetical protein